jgi:hypothetical protein
VGNRGRADRVLDHKMRVRTHALASEHGDRDLQAGHASSILVTRSTTNLYGLQRERCSQVDVSPRPLMVSSLRTAVGRLTDQIDATASFLRAVGAGRNDARNRARQSTNAREMGDCQIRLIMKFPMPSCSQEPEAERIRGFPRAPRRA